MMRLNLSQPVRCMQARCVQMARPIRTVAMQKSFFGTQLQRSSLVSAELAFLPHQPMRRSRGAVIVEANNKRCLGDTAYGTRRARTRTSGYRARKRTPGGRKVLKARQKKGRKTLCPANSNRGNKSTNAGNRR